MRRVVWFTFALLALVSTARAACPPGRFVVEGRPLIGTPAAADAVILAPGDAVSIVSGCPPIAADVRQTRKGARITVAWPRCGAREEVTLRARLDGRDCRRLRGTLRAAGTRRRAVRARRAVCEPTDQRCLRFTNVAHRGGADLRPENTLPAFAHAVELGADVLEMDVHATSDGVVVLHHDDTVDRTTDGTGPIAALALDDVRALNAGFQFTPDGGTTFPYRGAGIGVPTLEEVLTAFPSMPVSIEIKQYAPSIVDAVLDVLRRTGATGRAVVVSFDQGTMDAVRAAAPSELLTGMSLQEMGALGALTDETEASYVPPAPVAQLPYQAVTPELMARAERLGIVVQVWTVDDAADMRRMLALGVHGVMTNDPATLASVLAPAGIQSK